VNPETPALQHFAAPTAEWFRGAFEGPTAAQGEAWAAVTGGAHTLVVAPTGSGKTLAAFLSALDRLTSAPVPGEPRRRCRVLYVSPLKALATDVERNLRAPLTGIRQAAQRLGVDVSPVTVGMRTGDTPAAERRGFNRHPPDILVTTPESLFLLLSSSARDSLRGVETVIVDEVHALAGGKRGAHLALSLERLDALAERGPAQRIGLSATVRPVQEVADFLAGGRPTTVVAPERAKQLRVTVEVPVEDMTELGGPAEQSSGPADAVPRNSIWPAVEQRIFELVGKHRSTIVFANSRRLAERLTAKLNELAEPSAEEVEAFPAEAVGQSGTARAPDGPEGLVARAHHGSMSREQRTGVEEALKSGQLPCVVATSSLELGIDMGAVDAVIQVEAPPSVASGMQRIGRAGHHVGAVSEGVIFPKFRGDLVSAAVTAERMAAGAIEQLAYPRNPLDVLAQHVVSMLALDDWPVTALAELVRRAAPYRSLPDSGLNAVLDMLSGRYPSEEFGELRARITWDRVSGTLHGRPGAQRLAVTSGGTIPDRGLFQVTTPPEETGTSGRKVGELDEEMVYESRVGDTFLLGTSSWRVTDITHDRVIVTPAPGVAARMPFWKGDAPGRPLELGRALGRFLREMTGMDHDAATERARAAGLDDWAAENLLAYLAEQREATRHVPDDRTLLVERFRDELGDWRVVVHSPLGAKVNAPWALAIGARLRERRDADASVAHSDDGIVIRLPETLDQAEETTAPPLNPSDDLLFDPEEINELVTAEVGGSALFAARFRECAARSLLLPRRDPGRRTPLWQQRQRSAALLSVAARYEQFPVVLEAMRECLQDVYDLPGLREVMADVAARRIRVVEVQTPSASPFARSLLFGYVGMFVYEADAPLAERRAAALALDQTLLAELLGGEAIRELLDPDALAEIEADLQRLAPRRQVRDVEGAADLLRFLGDLTEAEAERRGVQPSWLHELRAQRRAVEVRIAGEDRWITIEDAGRVRDALGVALPVGIPEVFTEPVADPLGELLIRYARCRGPFRAACPAGRFGLGAGVVADVLDRLTASGTLVRGELRPLGHGEAATGGGVEYCDAGVLRRLRRASLAKLRAEVEPVEQQVLGRFLPAWHGISGQASSTSLHSTPSVEDVYSVFEQLAGAPLPASAVESLILPARLPGYSPALLDELTAAGEVTWTGAGSLSGSDGWVSFAPAEAAPLLLPDVEPSAPETPLHNAVLSTLQGGALFFRPLAEKVGTRLLDAGHAAPGDDALLAAIWDLVWAGRASNDTLAPLRSALSGGGSAHRTRSGPPRGRHTRRRPALPSWRGPATAVGRWSLVEPRSAEETRRTHARTEAFLDRHGVLTRGALETERVTGGFSGIYRVLSAMEDSGQVIRGYVVEGLGAAQFAARGAVDRLRAQAGTEDVPTVLVLAATDPAQPYGAALPWPGVVGETRHRAGRKAGALVALVGGAPALYVERGGHSLLSFTEDAATLRAAARGLADLVKRGRLAQLALRRTDGESAHSSALAEILTEAGFRSTPQGLRLRA
jgi:ATP-dependent Lhr-like helicase